MIPRTEAVMNCRINAEYHQRLYRRAGVNSSLAKQAGMTAEAFTASWNREQSSIEDITVKESQIDDGRVTMKFSEILFIYCSEKELRERNS